MPTLTEELLKAKIKENPMGAFLIFGEESYLVKVYVDKLIKASVDESFQDFNLRVYDGENIEVSEIYDNVTAVPVMSQSKCVVVKDFPFEKLNDNNMEGFAQILKDNPEDNCLIFSYTNETPKKNFAEAKKLFSDYGYVVNFANMQKNDLLKIVESGAKKRGKLMDRAVADYFVTCVGTDLNLLTNVLNKLCSYSKGESITRYDIDAICEKNIELNSFELAKDLANGNFDSAFKKLNILLEKGENENNILGALISQYVDIYRAKAISSAGESYSVLGQFYEKYKGKEFILKNAGRLAEKFSFDDLNKCLEFLKNADAEIKSTAPEQHKIILECTIVNLARTGR